MSNDQDFIDFVLDQVDRDVTFKHMFGGTTLYLNGKVVALICDNHLYFLILKYFQGFFSAFRQ